MVEKLQNKVATTMFLFLLGCVPLSFFWLLKVKPSSLLLLSRESRQDIAESPQHICCHFRFRAGWFSVDFVWFTQARSINFYLQTREAREDAAEIQ